MLVNNNQACYVLEEALGHMECVDFMRFGHNWPIGRLRSAFGHGRLRGRRNLWKVQENAGFGRNLRSTRQDRR